ncbi:MAG: hypothetical protein F9K16_14935 [Thermoanaerobaculia bacterium]|jgi:hypothetical protein|nr:MAG: hypothetical protein F9K16_14935 [Thermoanaerobaculia bacterium]MBZ0103066.1 hypothetical protein [Thermoanaerobaculia bacterium]
MSRDPLAAGRRRFERSLETLRDAFESELGSAPRIGRWALVLAAAATGFLAGQAVLGGARRRRRLAARRD